MGKELLKSMATLADLGFGKTMEKKLNAVGIYTAEELTEIGSKQAVFFLFTPMRIIMMRR